MRAVPIKDQQSYAYAKMLAEAGKWYSELAEIEVAELEAKFPALAYASEEELAEILHDDRY